MKFTSYKNWLFERKAETLEYGCIMMAADIPNWKEKISVVDKKDIYEKDDDYGYENEPHVTILYGLHDNEFDVKEIYDELKNLKPISVTIDKISIFENENFDVVKFDVPVIKELKQYRNQFIKKYPNTQTFPDYHPHMTICYTKPGTGYKYCKKIKPFNVTFDTTVYSGSNGIKKKFKI